MGFVYASFPGRKQATRAVSALVNQSFEPERIQVLARHSGRVQRVPVEPTHHLVLGTLLGGSLGALCGLGLGILLTDEPNPGPEWLFFAAGGFALGLLLGLRARAFRSRLAPNFPSRLQHNDGIVVGVFASAKRARNAKSALKTAQAARTFVAHGQPRPVRVRDAEQRPDSGLRAV